MFDYNKATKILKEAPGIIKLLEGDLEHVKADLSDTTVALIEKEISRQQFLIKEAELSLKYVDYQ